MSAPTEVVVGRIIGTPVERKEDKKLLQGQAQWVDNMRVPGMVYLGVVRSHPQNRKNAPGVHGGWSAIVDKGAGLRMLPDRLGSGFLIDAILVVRRQRLLDDEIGR